MSSVRWSPEQLADYERRRQQATRDITPAVAARAAKVERPKESRLERRFTQQLTDAGITDYQRNYFFLPDREFELDYAWSRLKVYVEVQGGVHVVKGQFAADIEKRALALFAGWRGLEVDVKSIRDGRAIEWTKRLIGG